MMPSSSALGKEGADDEGDVLAEFRSGQFRAHPAFVPLHSGGERPGLQLRPSSPASDGCGFVAAAAQAHTCQRLAGRPRAPQGYSGTAMPQLSAIERASLSKSSRQSMTA